MRLKNTYYQLSCIFSDKSELVGVPVCANVFNKLASRPTSPSLYEGIDTSERTERSSEPQGREVLRTDGAKQQPTG